MSDSRVSSTLGTSGVISGHLELTETGEFLELQMLEVYIFPYRNEESTWYKKIRRGRVDPANLRPPDEGTRETRLATTRCRP